MRPILCKASSRIELLHNGFADRSLTAWVRRQIHYGNIHEMDGFV